MENTKRTVLALVAMIALIGIVPMPTQAVNPDCSAEEQMPEGDPGADESLSAQSAVTWSVNNAHDEDLKVRVELRSIPSILDFGVFVVDDQTCEVAENVMSIDCGDEEQIVTDLNNQPPQEKVCTLDAPGSGTLTYYFHLENNQQIGLSYRIWYEDV